MQTIKNEGMAGYKPRVSRFGKFSMALLLSSSLAITCANTMAVASETRLSELLRDNLQNSGIDTSAVSFVETDGVVTISGQVTDAKQRKLLLDLISRTHGVRKVVDELETDYDS